VDRAHHFGRFDAAARAARRLAKQPLALRYHGHQFRPTTPTSATGAASCSRSCATTGRLLDLGTKGSGQTPYSRAAATGG
jgi:uncharacterized protein YdiU (UPF0061 family)